MNRQRAGKKVRGKIRAFYNKTWHKYKEQTEREKYI